MPIGHAGRRSDGGAGKWTPMTAPVPDNDPMPQPPEQPDLDACCGNGCDPCIFDTYDLDMDAYRQALRAWRARNEGAAAGQG